MILKTIIAAFVSYFTYNLSNRWPPNVAYELCDGDSYDFIVVGSGSAGSPVAARLAERGQNVLLLEAGGEPPWSSVVIKNDLKMTLSSLSNPSEGLCLFIPSTYIDWQYACEYQEGACQSLINKQCHKPRGKVLGGSSTLNTLIFVRGNRADYDDWNSSSWTYDKMLPYFLRLESLTGYDDFPPEIKQYHNKDGPLKITIDNSSSIPWRDELITAYREIGFERNWDASGPSQIGITITPSTIYDGERQSTAEAYLAPHSTNKYLNVAYNSYVTKIIINKNNVAKGVRVNINGRNVISIKAKKEVILSTGTINTPHLLMLSGIGPKSELERHGIQAYVDNPHVGQGLQDHPSTPIILTANTGVTTPISEFDYVSSVSEQYLFNKSGPGATNLGTDISAFIDTLNGSSIPDVQFVHVVAYRNQALTARIGLEKMYSFNHEIIQDIVELNADSDILIIMPILLRPISRGSIHLASKNPYQYPIIHGNTLVEPKDYETYLRGISIIEKLLQSESFLKNNIKPAKINSLRECNIHKFRSDAYWICYRNHMGDTLYHPVGTASIGRVVDEKLQVYGVKSLRVADASVMPLISRGNTNAPTIAIGERAADFISNDHEL